MTSAEAVPFGEVEVADEDIVLPGGAASGVGITFKMLIPMAGVNVVSPLYAALTVIGPAGRDASARRHEAIPSETVAEHVAEPAMNVTVPVGWPCGADTAAETRRGWPTVGVGGVALTATVGISGELAATATGVPVSWFKVGNVDPSTTAAIQPVVWVLWIENGAQAVPVHQTTELPSPTRRWSG